MITDDAICCGNEDVACRSSIYDVISLEPLDSDLASELLHNTPQRALPLPLTEDSFGYNLCCIGDDPHKQHVFLLRLVGGFCVVFASVEIFLGVHLSPYFSNFINGVWWAAVPVLIAGISSVSATSFLSLFIVSGLSVIGAVISVVGLYNEASAATAVRSIASCGSRVSYSSPVVYYEADSSSDKENVNVCMLAALRLRTFQYGSCYCTNSDGSYCGQLTLSSAVDCNAIFSSYKAFLTDSTVIIALTALGAVTLSVLGLSMILCPGRLGGYRRADALRVQTQLQPLIGISGPECAGEEEEEKT